MLRHFCRRCIGNIRWSTSENASRITARGKHAGYPHYRTSLSYHHHPNIPGAKYFRTSSAISQANEKLYNEAEQVEPDIHEKPKIKNYTVGRNVQDLIAIRKNPAYHGLFFHYDPQQVQSQIVHPAVKNFIALARSADAAATHPKYRDEIDKLVSCLGEITDLEFQYVLYHLRLFVRSKVAGFGKEYAKVWKPLDEECIRRGVERKKWRAEINFVYANLWDFLLLGRQSTFHWLFIKICIRKVDSLSREKFVRLCQSICRSKQLPKDIKLYNLQYNVSRIIEESTNNSNARPITTEELCAVCCVFFKMRYPFQDPETAVKILDIVIKNSKTVSNSSLSGICNGISMSKRLNISDKISQMMDAMLDQVPRLDLNACASLLMLASRNRVRHPGILAAIANRLETLKDMPQETEVHHVDWLASSFKDLDRPSSPAFKTILNIMTIYAEASKQRQQELGSDAGVDDESESDDDDCDDNNEKAGGNKEHDQQLSSTCSGENGIEKITTKEEGEIEDFIAKLFQKRLVSILHSLAYGGVYPRKLIAKALSPEFLNKTYGKRMHTYTTELLLLDQDVAEELADYDGPRLPTKSIEFLTKAIMKWVPPSTKFKVHPYEFMCRNVMEISSEILGGSSHVHLCNLVPHFGTIEAVFCTTKSGVPIPVPESFKSKQDHRPKILLPEDCPEEIQYHAIIMYYFDALIFSSDEPLGRYSKLKEKVEKMGYKTYEVSYNSWKILPKEEMSNYIRTKLHTIVDKMIKTDFKESVTQP